MDLEWKWGRVVRAMSMVIGVGSWTGGLVSCCAASSVFGICCWDWDWRCWRRSEAKMVIMASLCSKGAGWGALSAFWVARRRRSRLGERACLSERRADVAMRRWARVGGLKDESRM